MADTIVEVIKFTSSGVPEIVAQTKVMSREANETSKRYTTLQGLLASPAFAKHAAATDRMAKSHELLNQRLKNQSLAQRIADGSALRQLRTAQLLNRQYADMQRRLEFSARYGERLGGFMARWGGAVSGAAGAVGLGAAAVAGAGLGMARSGFEGTVEQARFDAEMKQLQRELAGVMKPVMDVMTKGARAVRKELERLDGRGQDAVMGGLLLGGTAAGGYMLRRLLGGGFGMFGGAGGAASGAASGAAGSAGGGFFGGRRGLLRMGAGFAGAGLAAHGIATENPFTAGIGGAMAGAAAWGPLAPVAAGAALAAAAPNRREGEKPFDYYRRMREGGSSKVGAALLTGGEALSSLFGGDTEEQRRARAGRRQVTLAGGGFEAAGSGYDRLSAGIEKVEGADTAANRELNATMKELIETLRRAGAPLPPRPSGA